MPIPNVEFIRVIPFDPPEAASVELVSRKQRLYTPEEAADLIPYLTCLKPEGVQTIIVNGKGLCRKDQKCGEKLDSVRDTVEMLDGIAGKVIGIK
jgi:aminopeptidase-like protein